MVQRKVRWLAGHVDLKDKYSTHKPVGRSDETQAPLGKIKFATIERFVGFLVYVSQTYTSVVSYLKSTYLTLNSWRPGRNTEGWPLTEYKKDSNEVCQDDLSPPVWVTMVPQFKLDMHALLVLTCYKNLPKLPVWSQSKNTTYTMGDTLGTKFGLCCWTQGTEEVRVEFRRWTEEVELDKSSNFREAGNLVVGIMRMVATRQIPNELDIFVFTDNKVMESTYLGGLSKSSKLHNIIVQLHKLEMEGNFIIHFI